MRLTGGGVSLGVSPAGELQPKDRERRSEFD